MDKLGRLERRRAGRIAPFVFTGVQLFSRRLLEGAPDGAFSTNILWDRAIAAGRLFGLSHNGRWFDVGTPDAIPRVEAELADG
jgi:MurNAc alpha-1-phosphate uridylyltransferase